MSHPELAGIEICVFDAYGTLYDFNSAVARHRTVIGPKADVLSEMWRTKQIQYTWLRNSMGAYAPFWQVTGEALDHCLAAQGIASKRSARPEACTIGSSIPGLPFDRMAQRTPARRSRSSIPGTSGNGSSAR